MHVLREQAHKFAELYNMLVSYLSKRRLGHHAEHFIKDLAKLTQRTSRFHELITHVSGGHSCELSVGVVSGSDLLNGDYKDVPRS